MLYYLFKKSNKAVWLGGRAGTPHPTNWSLGRGTADKADPTWEMKDLYYDARSSENRGSGGLTNPDLPKV